ncbi:putative transcriptional regulator [Viridothelium virens]|uniref:Putative transcriptional regulator n=1 Tax=Viridothelium virens TaxID=1048519 RepID=A0A6A6GYG0_VIRVR|nr:putative transcriptional regulator [Viridothelium virens]
MYLRQVHANNYLPTLFSFLQTNPLGVLNTAIPSPDHPLIQASHIPWVFDFPTEYDSTTPATDPSLDAAWRASNGKPLGRLRGHMARANPQAKALIAAAVQASGSSKTNLVDEAGSGQLPDQPVTLQDEVLVLFTGPISHYVTPKFYTSTKPATGKVVPTWNYEAVQAYGQITVFPSTTSDVSTTFLQEAIEDLSRQEELGMGFGQANSKGDWKVKDAPEKYITLLKKSIVGVQVDVKRLGGKFKMSQEIGEGDRKGVVQGFQEIGETHMAGSVQRWGAKR